MGGIWLSRFYPDGEEYSARKSGSTTESDSTRHGEDYAGSKIETKNSNIKIRRKTEITDLVEIKETKITCCVLLATKRNIGIPRRG